MKVNELIQEVNKNVENLDFVTTRKLIEDNIEMLSKHKVLLKSNARELLKMLEDRLDAGYEPISRQDMATVIALNTYATKFDIRSIKLIVKDKAKLLLRKDVVEYLNKDAKVLLEGMGVIEKIS
ncbi:hypothetical protein [Cytobacillus praedii]|uniref:Uncharacterized protein n=1 Tax=Cytobacillus praedii TaxID=1742358 RepID=A0A4R1AYV7_9BACI|nr:hypothetical protein [Cytobacillus praedii]TCJ05166.1 hypothetical protein E0Y62_05755 [Cytobacillus praedii]